MRARRDRRAGQTLSGLYDLPSELQWPAGLVISIRSDQYRLMVQILSSIALMYKWCRWFDWRLHRSGINGKTAGQAVTPVNGIAVPPSGDGPRVLRHRVMRGQPVQNRRVVRGHRILDAAGSRELGALGPAPGGCRQAPGSAAALARMSCAGWPLNGEMLSRQGRTCTARAGPWQRDCAWTSPEPRWRYS